MPQELCTEESPYLGSFLAALLVQRGSRFRGMACELAKQCAELLVQHRQSFLGPLNEDSVFSLAVHRDFGGKIDSSIIYMIFAGVLDGKYKDLQTGLDAHKVNLKPAKILKDFGFKRWVGKLLFLWNMVERIPKSQQSNSWTE